MLLRCWAGAAFSGSDVWRQGAICMRQLGASIEKHVSNCGWLNREVLLEGDTRK